MEKIEMIVVFCLLSAYLGLCGISIFLKSAAQRPAPLAQTAPQRKAEVRHMMFQNDELIKNFRKEEMEQQRATERRWLIERIIANDRSDDVIRSWRENCKLVNERFMREQEARMRNELLAS